MELFRLKGASVDNITNRNKKGEGLQLEFHLDLLKGLAIASESEIENNKYKAYEKAILNAVDRVKVAKIE